MWCHPVQFETRRMSLEQMRSCAERASVNFRGWPFLFISNERPEETYAIQDGLETLIPFQDFSGHDRVDFWQFHQQ